MFFYNLENFCNSSQTVGELLLFLFTHKNVGLFPKLEEVACPQTTTFIGPRGARIMPIVAIVGSLWAQCRPNQRDC